MYVVHLSFFIIIVIKKCKINIVKLYISSTVLPCILSTPTSFDILCYPQGITFLLRAKLHKSLVWQLSKFVKL
jgi:hypothetical protein